MQRYSLQALANQALTADTAEELLQAVAGRLALQTSACQALKKQSNNRELTRNLDHLHYVHMDTHRLSQKVAEHPRLYETFAKADRHVVHATLEQVRSRHASTLERWVDVVQAEPKWESAVINVLKRRSGIQLLCDHYVKLDKGREHGGVSLDCRIDGKIDEAFTEARHLCEANLQVSPEIDFVQSNQRITMIRPWLHHVFVELFKNAMHASVKRAQRDGLQAPPAIVVEVRRDETSLSVDIIDSGVGVDLQDAAEIDRQLFGLGESSAGRRWDRLDDQQSYAAVRSPLSSLGVGLPVSRIMMEHIGGTVELLPRPETGCVATVTIPLDTAILEPEVAVS